MDIKVKELDAASINEAFKGLTDAIEAKDAAGIAKYNEILAEVDKKNQALVLDIKKREATEAELKESISNLEKQISRASQAGDEKKKGELSEEMKAVTTFIRHGEASLTAEELKYLRTDKDTDGGYLTQGEYIREIIKGITEISPMRSVARVRQTSSKSVEIPSRTGLVTASWEGEATTTGDSNSTYGLERIPMNKLMVNVPITIEELADASFNMETEINADVVESFNQKENLAFVSGTGVKQPEGFLTNASVGIRASGIADNIDIDSLILLAGDLKTGYNPVYAMNRLTIASLRTRKGGDGQYLWVAGNIAAGVPNTINGYNYVEMPDMDNIGANAYPVAFGDFRQGYLIVDRMDINMIRDPYSLKRIGKVEFTFTRRVAGQVVKAEAIKKLKCSIS